MSRKSQNILIVAGLLGLFVLLNLPLTSKTSPDSTPEPRTTKASIDPYIDQIAAYQEELARTDLSEEARTLLEAKLYSITLSATQRAEGLESAPTKPVIMPATPTFIESGFKLPDGIDPNPPNIPIPVAHALEIVLSSWKKTTELRTYFIFTGVLRQDGQQGAIMVQNPRTFQFKLYETPERSGGVMVIAENGMVITLKSTTGAVYYFDVDLEWFINLEGTPQPAYTPSPTLIPTNTSTPTLMPPYP